METSRLQENISAMVDDALPPCEVELTLAALAEPQGQAAWHLYHLIGDVLRGDAPGNQLSALFTARLAARLVREEPPRPGSTSPRDPVDGPPTTVTVR